MDDDSVSVLFSRTFRDKDAVSHSLECTLSQRLEARCIQGENGNNRTAGGETESRQIVSQSFWRTWRNDSTLSHFRHLSVGSRDYRLSRAGPFSLIFHTKTK